MKKWGKKSAAYIGARTVYIFGCLLTVAWLRPSNTYLFYIPIGQKVVIMCLTSIKLYTYNIIDSIRQKISSALEIVSLS